MAEYRVLQTYKDTELKKVLNSGERVEMTVKRANYVNKENNYGIKFLERIEEEDNEEEDEKQVMLNDYFRPHHRNEATFENLSPV